MTIVTEKFVGTARMLVVQQWWARRREKDDMSPSGMMIATPADGSQMTTLSPSRDMHGKSAASLCDGMLQKKCKKHTLVSMCQEISTKAYNVALSAQLCPSLFVTSDAQTLC